LIVFDPTDLQKWTLQAKAQEIMEALLGQMQVFLQLYQAMKGLPLCMEVVMAALRATIVPRLKLG